MKNEPNGLNKLGPPVRVKVQSVHTTMLLPEDDGGMSLGAHIDRMIDGYRHDGHYPNKVVIEINPPQDRPESCE